jgi:hypothetical protein
VSLEFVKLIFIFLAGLFLALSVFEQGRLSFIAALVFGSQLFLIQSILFLFTLTLVYPTPLAYLFRALNEFILEFSFLFLFFLRLLSKIFQQLVCAFLIQLILFLFKFLLWLRLFLLLLFS